MDIVYIRHNILSVGARTSDCITSYDKKKLPEMLAHYEQKGWRVERFSKAAL